MSTSDDRDQRVNEAIAEYLAGCDAGTPPDRAAFLTRHADVADSLRAFLADHDGMQKAAPPLPAVGEPETLGSEPFGAPALGSIRYFGDYELLDEIARGGMGVVYRAKQVSLNRVVAVKMILAGAYAGDRDVQRFRAEAEAAANLDHPHILPIYEVGDHAGHQYFSMKYIEGGSLASPVAAGGANVRERVLILTRVCRAVHHAHQRGILHRDLKPGNILLDADGTPYVTDFGLAKKVEGESGLTQSGALVGTPSYMPPEQARGEKRVTTQADVYSLGAILYELLTGRPPFREATILDTVLAVIEKEPDHPRLVEPTADRDLSVIALKCLDKDPRMRYTSAQALADDLERWSNGEPILARPAPAWEKTMRWAKRRPAAAALVATCALAVIAGIAGLAVSNRMIALKQQETDAALRDRTAALEESAGLLIREKEARKETATTLSQLKVEQARTKAALQAERRSAYLSDIALAASEWAGNRPIRAAQLLDGCPADLRGWEWHHLRRVGHAAERDYPGIHRVTRLCGVSPDGKLILTTDSGAVHIREFATGKVIRSFADHAYEVSAAALSPDGKRVASAAAEVFSLGGNQKGQVILWEKDTCTVLRTFATDHKGVSALMFSGDGQWLATAGGDRTVRLWRADGSKEVHRWTLPPQKDAAFGTILTFSPDSKQLAYGGPTTMIWDVEKKTVLREIKGEAWPVYSRDGKRLATMRGTTELVVRDPASWAEQMAQRIDTPMVTALAFTPEGKRIAVGGMDGIVHIWDVTTRTEVQTIRGQQGWVIGLEFAPDGARLVTSIGDPVLELFESWSGRSPPPAAVRLWDLARGQDYRLLPASGAIFAAHPSRSEFAVATGKEVHLFDPTTGAKRRLAATAAANITAIAYSPDGTTLALAWSMPPMLGKELSPGVRESRPVKLPQRIQLFDPATGKPKAEAHAQETSIGEMCFSPDGKVLATTGWGKTLTLLDAATGKMIAALEGAEGGATRLTFATNGMLIRATTGSVSWSNSEPERRMDAIIELWDVAALKRLRTVKGWKGFCHAIAVSPDGKLLAAAGGEGLAVIQGGTMRDSVGVIHLDTGERKWLPTPAHSLAFSPDGQRLVAATPVGVKFWDPVSGRDILTLGGKWTPTGNSSRVVFARPAGLLLVNESDGLRVYDGRTWEPPPQPLLAQTKPPPEPKQEPPADNRPAAVKTAVANAIAASDANDPAAAALHAVAALAADPDPSRQQMHRQRIALALQATPKLRPIIASGAREPSGYALDRVSDPPSTTNVCDPARSWNDPVTLLRSADGKRFATWSPRLSQQAMAQAKKAGLSPWLVHVHDAATGKQVGPPIDLGQRPTWPGVAFSPDGQRVAALFAPAGPPPAANAPVGFLVQVWDATTGKRLGAEFRGSQTGTSPSIDFAGSNLLVVKTHNNLWSNDTTQTFWNVETGKQAAFQDSVGAVFSVPGVPFLVTAGGKGQGGRTHVRDARTLAVIGKPLVVTDVRAAATSADARRVVIGNSYWLGTWDVTTGERLHRPFVVYGGAKCVAITADGSRVAAGFKDRGGTAQVRIWDGRTGNAISVPMKTGDDSRMVYFAAAGQAVVTVTRKAVQLWDASTGEPLTPLLTGDGRHGFSFGYGRQADALVRDEVMLVRRTYETSQYDRWSLAPAQGSVADLRDLAEAMAGRHRDPAGDLRPIAAEELLALRKRISRRFPERFGTPIGSANAVLTRRPDPRVEQLAVQLADVLSTAEVRCRAAQMIGELKDPAGQAPLVLALRDADAAIRRSAARAIGELDPRTAETVHALVRMLREEKDDNARANAARSLHGSAAKLATTELLRALKEDKAAGVREGAAFSLRCAMAHAVLLAALRVACDDPQSWLVRVEAAMSLASLDPSDKAGVQVLMSALGEKNDWVVQVAAQYLYELGPRAATAAAALAQVFEKGKYDPHWINQAWYALHALARIGSKAKPAVPVLLARLEQDQANPHWFNPATNYVTVAENRLAYTLARIGPDMVPDLLKLFHEDKNAKRRRAAVLALGFLGPKAKAARADLEAEAKALADKETKSQDDQWLEKALEKALGRIRDPKAIPIEKME
jgi:WD40 repeat protein/HEAT repeat protein